MRIYQTRKKQTEYRPLWNWSFNRIWMNVRVSVYGIFRHWQFFYGVFHLYRLSIIYWVNGARKIPIFVVFILLMRLFATFIHHCNAIIFCFADTLFSSMWRCCNWYWMCNVHASARKFPMCLFYSWHFEVNRFCHSIDLPFTTCAMQSTRATSSQQQQQQNPVKPTAEQKYINEHFGNHDRHVMWYCSMWSVKMVVDDGNYVVVVLVHIIGMQIVGLSVRIAVLVWTLFDLSYAPLYPALQSVRATGVTTSTPVTSELINGNS